MGYKIEDNILRVWCDGPECKGHLAFDKLQLERESIHALIVARDWIYCFVDVGNAEVPAHFCSVDCREKKEAEFA